MFSSLLTFLPALAGVAAAIKGQNVVYWGQNGGGTIENNDLSSYCTATSGIDILVLAFLCKSGVSRAFGLPIYPEKKQEKKKIY